MRAPDRKRLDNLDRALEMLERIAPYLVLTIVVAAAVLLILLSLAGTSWKP